MKTIKECYAEWAMQEYDTSGLRHNLSLLLRTPRLNDLSIFHLLTVQVHAVML